MFYRVLYFNYVASSSAWLLVMYFLTNFDVLIVNVLASINGSWLVIIKSNVIYSNLEVYALHF